MRTEALSPGRAAGLPQFTRRAAASELEARAHFACGDLVRERGGRHEGRVTWTHGSQVGVRWEGSGWRSQHHWDELERVR